MSAYDSDDVDDPGLLRTLKMAVECSICLQTFRNPKTLPCGHTYCAACVDCQITSKGKLKCALCSVVSRMPKNGLAVSYVIKG